MMFGQKDSHAVFVATSCSAAEVTSADDRVPVASVIAPVNTGPSVCPMLNAIVMMAIAFGQASLA